MTHPDPVLAAAERRSAALVHKDVAALLALLHPDFMYVNASGHVLDRDQYLDRYVRPVEVQWASQTLEEPRIVKASGVAVLICRVRDVARFHDRHMDETFRSTFTWILTDQGWRCLAGHTSRPPVP
jgi:hypothetical protein